LKQVVWSIALTALLTSPERGASWQTAASDRETEQTVFNAEGDASGVLVKSPVKIPDSALQVLRDTLTGGKYNCLKSRGTSPAEAPAPWFLASAIHLNGPDEVDLIVVPNVPIISEPSNPGGCLLSAHGGPFWVLGPGIASGRYGLLLATYGDQLEILNEKTNRYKDIQKVSGQTTILYKYTVSQYQQVEKRTE
jgi:hypothetical protein